MRKIRIRKKNQSNSRALRCQFRKLQLTVLLMMICLACAVSSAGTSKLYPPTKSQTGALRLAEVVQIATREEILGLGVSLQHLLASGLKDSDFKDGSLATGRVYCCHPSTDEGRAMWFYVPSDAPVKLGDIVVIRMGRESTKKDPGTVNVVIEVRQKQGAPDSQCSWDPPNDKLWGRLLYCTWMPAEGWTLEKGFWNTWLKRASDAKAQ
jgi:hypothetical protein